MYIENVSAIEVMDSRGNPTVKATVELSDGTIESAIVPSGASTGKREALELRDGDERYMGKGVLKAVSHVNNEISDALIGQSPFNQAVIDAIMKEVDSTENYGNLGANSVLGVSMAVARAAAESLKIPLYRYLGGANAMTMPVPMFNIINGGEHANNSVDFQEYMIMPTGFDNFSDALRASVETYHALKKLLLENGHSTALGDEGGFAPNLSSNEEPLEYLVKAIEKAGAFALVIEGVKSDTAKAVTKSVDIPTIGIGAGLDVDGQVLVWSDMLGFYEEFTPKFVKKYIEGATMVKEAISTYKKEVQDGSFPSKQYIY